MAQFEREMMLERQREAQDAIRLFKEGNAAASSRLRHGSSLPGE